MIFQEYPARSPQGYPESIDDMRYIGSAISSSTVFTMLNGPSSHKYLTKVSVQCMNDTKIVMEERYLITHITISKSRFGIEVLGPCIDTMQKLFNHVIDTARPICIEVTISDSTDETKSEIGSYTSHGIILAIMPPKSPKVQKVTSADEKSDKTEQPARGKIYLIDPNSCSKIAQYNSSDIETALKPLLPADARFEFVPQRSWLKNRSFNINGSYADLGVSSGWCRTISILIAGMIMRRDYPVDPEDVLPRIAKYPRELCIMMFDATIRHTVSHLLSAFDCTEIIKKRDEQAKKYQAEVAAKKK
jgi:hypothetical protein